ATGDGLAIAFRVGATLRDKGIQRLLDAVVALLPSPLDRPPVRGQDESGAAAERPGSPDAAPAALAFKTLHDRTGDLTFLRIYAGTVRTGDALYNPRMSSPERLGRLMVMKANHREPVAEAAAGEIVAALGLKTTVTGDTLCTKREPIVLEPMVFPESVISTAVRPRRRGDRERLGEALAALGREDPSFRYSTDPETQEMVIAGMGELHLEVVLNRLRTDFGINVDVGAPRVAYRQTLRGPCDVEGRFVKQTGGRGQFGVVRIRFSPGRETEPVFVSSVVGGNVPREYVPAVDKGLRRIYAGGGEAGFPFVRVCADLYDGKAHSVDSSETAFQEAARLAFRSAVQAVGVALLEPVMRVAVRVPAEHLGDVIASLNARRAVVQEVGDTSAACVEIQGRVPLAEMFQYATLLRSLTAGRGQHHLEPDAYEEVPADLAERVLREAVERRRRNV
ncbi:MAG: EF-Tu/IF-2/RF-3 family GTPase, partial [Planctomycetota bacterium]